MDNSPAPEPVDPSLPPRLMAWYAGSVGALGMLPFLAVRLTDAGFSDATATALLLMLPLGTLFGGPAWAWLVDRAGRARRTLLVALTLATLGVTGLLVDDTRVMVLAVALFAASRAPIFPLGDSLTVRVMGDRYGSVRAIGSIAYIAVVLSSGAMRDTWPRWPVAMAVVLLAVTTAISATLPEIPPSRRPDRSDLAALAGDPRVRGLLLVAFLNGLSITTYDHLFTLHLDRAGVPAWLTGAAVAWGVTVEVAVMFAGSFLLRRFGAPRLILLGCAAGIPRFAITALAADSPWVVAACQGLHGLQFGAFWIAAVHLMSVLAPENLRRSAQALLPATGFGLATLCSLAGSAAWLTFGTTRGLFAALLVPAAVATLAATRLSGQSSSAPSRSA